MSARLGGLCLASSLLALAAVPLGSQTPRRTAADGVYTTDQATRGEMVFAAHCAECHGEDLEGLEGPQLAGSLFLRTWRARTVGDLFRKIVESMPKGSAESVTDTDKLDAVAFLLSANAFPAGRVELKPDAAALAGIPLGQSADGQPLPGAVVTARGCLEETAENQWKLAGDQPLRLLNVFPKPTAHAGHTVVVTGLFVREAAGDALNVISIETVATTCAR